MKYYLFDTGITENLIMLGHIDYDDFIWNYEELNKQYDLNFKQGDSEKILNWLKSKIDTGCYITNETMYNTFDIDSFKKIIYNNQNSINNNDNTNKSLLDKINSIESHLIIIERLFNETQKSIRYESQK